MSTADEKRDRIRVTLKRTVRESVAGQPEFESSDFWEGVNRILAAIDELGFRIVKLPERNGNGEWPVGDGTVVYYDGNDEEIWYKLQCYPAAKARGVAAGLLAAADYAESDEARS